MVQLLQRTVQQFLKKFIYLFLTVLSLHSCSGFFLVSGSGGYSLAAVCRLLMVVASPVGQQGLQDLGTSVVAAPGFQSTVAHELSCSMACGIFLDQASDLCLLHWQANSLPLSYQGSPGNFFRKLNLQQPSNCTPRHLPLRERKTYDHTEICVKLLTAVLLVVANNQK